MNNQPRIRERYLGGRKFPTKPAIFSNAYTTDVWYAALPSKFTYEFARRFGSFEEALECVNNYWNERRQDIKENWR